MQTFAPTRQGHIRQSAGKSGAQTAHKWCTIGLARDGVKICDARKRCARKCLIILDLASGLIEAVSAEKRKARAAEQNPVLSAK